MQTSNGEHHRQPQQQQQQQQQQPPYFMGGQCDPNLIAFAQHALLNYPGQHKNAYPQAFPAQQLPPLMLPTQATMLPMQMPLRGLHPSLSIPEMDKMSMEEPIEAGNLPYRRGNNKSTSASQSIADDSFNNMHRSTSSSSHNYRRHSAQWETMTDDERELIQRQKRKEEAFKTALCDAYKRSGTCPYGEACRFAHGENELRMPSQPRGKAHPKYKTQLCDKFSTYGQCPYGPRCQFIHKLKKGLPLMEYNRALYQGEISPARDDEITNPDESSGDNSALNLTRTLLRRRPASANAANGVLDMSDSGYSGGNRRRSLQHYDQFEDVVRSNPSRGSAGKVVYPPMQVVNIEMATGQKKSSERRSVINQADYEASMASGKMFGKPENIRTYGAMIRANEDHVERHQTGSKKEKLKIQPKKNLSLIREEDTLLVEGSQLHSSATAPTLSPSAITTTTTTTSSGPTPSSSSSQPWYEKIFGKKMTMIKEESDGEDDLDDCDDETCENERERNAASLA